MATQQTMPAQAVTAEAPKSLLDQIVERSALAKAEVASRYQPIMDFEELKRRYDLMRQLKNTVLIEGEDYVSIPGVDKPFLSKAGAQKLCVFFGYVPHYEEMVVIEDWSGEKFGEPLFYYKFSCTLRKDGKPVGEGIGSANSWEAKYRYRWVPEADAKRIKGWESLVTKGGSISEPDFAIEKAETSGKYGKPAEYWYRFQEAIANGAARKVKRKKKTGGDMAAWEIDATVYRIPNDQFPDVINTCQKQGEKRAYVEATLSATGLANLFTQDEEAVQPAPKPTAAGLEWGGAGWKEETDFPFEPPADFAPEPKQEPKPAAAPKTRTTPFNILGEFAKLKKRYTKLGVEDVYYTILPKYGVEKSDQFPATEQGKNSARACYRELRTVVEGLEADAAPEPEAPVEKLVPPKKIVVVADWADLDSQPDAGEAGQYQPWIPSK